MSNASHALTVWHRLTTWSAYRRSRMRVCLAPWPWQWVMHSMLQSIAQHVDLACQMHRMAAAKLKSIKADDL